jgi:hypothetical protein
MDVNYTEEQESHDEVPVDTGARAVLAMAIMYNVEPETMGTLWVAASRYGRERLRFIWQDRTMIAQSRDRLAERYINDFDSEYLIMADGDMAYPCGNAKLLRSITHTTLPDQFLSINFFDRLLSHPPSIGIVGGVYWDRKVGGDIMCAGGCGPAKDANFVNSIRNGTKRGLVERQWVATGCIRIHRRVFQKIMADPVLFNDIAPKHGLKRWGFFTPGHGLGEDVSFNLRAGQVGEKVMLDTGLRCFHKGVAWF